MKNNSIKKNAFLNVARAATTVIFPLITFPYTSRVLQVDNMGKVSFGISIITYFSLIAGLGINVYGVREGAKLRENRESFQRFASEIFTVNMVMTVFAYLLLGLTMLLPKFQGYREVILILGTQVLFTTIGIEWVNTVFEDFLFITVRSVIAQIIGLAGLFIFVRKPEDYLVYAWITVLSVGVTRVVNWFYCRKYAQIRLSLSKALWKHFAPMWVFFSNSLAVTIYVSADSTMLGWMAGDYYNGLYSVSVRVYQIIRNLLSALYAVTIPRLSAYAYEGKNEEYRSLLTEIGSYIILLLIPCMAGLIVFAKEIILLIAGRSYLQAERSLQILGAALIFAVASGVVVNCINTPHGFEKTSLEGTIIAAITNIVLNLFFIRIMRQEGAAITTVVAEAIVFAFCLTRLKHIDAYIDVKEIIRQVMYAAAGSVLIFITGFTLKKFIASPLFALACGLVACPVCYLVMLAAGKNRFVVRLISNRLKR